MTPTKHQFLQDVLRQAEQVVENNWEPWCHLPESPDYWREQGAQWLDVVITNWQAFAQIFSLLADEVSRDVLYSVMLFRTLGYRHVRLPINTARYWQMRAKAEASVIGPAPGGSATFDLQQLNWDGFTFTGHPGGALCLLGLQQYQLQRDVSIRPETGDVVLDLGGCWGDSGLVFADRVGPDGRVFVFEFVEGNVAIAQENFAGNPILSPRIDLVRHPVSNTSGDVLYYVDRGPATVVSQSPAGATGSATTVTIDSFVASRALTKVDFIKMDIEGVERQALAGAVETIGRCRPKLAISAYHLVDDLVVLPQLIKRLHPDYRLYLDQYTLYDQELVLYAI